MINAFFIVFLLTVFIVSGISAAVIHWLNKITAELKVEIPQSKQDRPSIMYLIQEGFIVIESYERANTAPAWYLHRFGTTASFSVEKQAGQPFIIGYTDEPNTKVVVPDKYVCHVEF